MKNNVMISLKSVTFQDDEKSETELMTQAVYTKKNGCHVFTYEDTSATGFEGCTTNITVEKSGMVFITRTGTANSNLTLEKERKHYCHYGTPYGDLQIGIYTSLIRDNIDDSGELEMKYTLDINSVYLSDNELTLKIQNFGKEN